MRNHDRLIYRAIIEDKQGCRSDLRVLANEHGLLNIYLTGIARSLSYAGIDELRLPASVAQGGGTNQKIAEKVRRSVARPYEIERDWVEPEPTAGANRTEV